MICPKCGKWNRASYPVCFACGEPLTPGEKSGILRPKEAISEERPVVVVYDDYGEEKTLVDRKTRLAEEMRDLHVRKREGERRQEELRRRAAQRGYAPTGAGVTGASRRSSVFVQGESGREYTAPDQHVDYDGYMAEPNYAYATDELRAVSPLRRGGGTRGPGIPISGKKSRRARLFGLRRVMPLIAGLLILAGIGFAGWRYLYLPTLDKAQQGVDIPRIDVTASILDDMAAHTIRIPAPEGSQIYIKELRRTYIVTGGYAVFQVQDYIWYDGMEGEIPESMDVSITPYIRTSAGEQVQMDIISYRIDIPLSPLTLIKPDVTYIEASTPIYNIQFHVMQNSTVFINGEDYSSYVNTQDGYITYNAPIQPIGENRIHIAVRSQYYRENETELTIFRAVQDVPLDLASTLEDRSTKPKMTISATTRAGAAITILSPYYNLDDSRLASTGAFSFEAVFNRIGTNTVIIRADYPGSEPTIVEYDVYYLPDPDHYTPKAWALDEKFGYSNLLANLSTHVKNTQIYTFTGPVLRVVSSKPQLVIIDCADGRTASPLEVMVENQTKTQWEVGQRYRLYADASGSYGGIPRVTARYTYKPKN